MMNARPGSRKPAFAALAILLSVLAALVLGEILTRLFWRGPAFITDERNLTYKYDSELGWFPIPGGSNVFKGDHLFTIQHNADGFRDVPHGAKTRKRIAFVGDSFVWGYDAELTDLFTGKLQARLKDWEVLNLGVSGYATDQEQLLLQRWFAHFQPDVIVLVFSDNDVDENTLNMVHGGYYKPWFEANGSQLTEHGVPVPKCIHYYRAEHPLLLRSHLVQLLLTRYIASKNPLHVTSPNPTLPLVLEFRRYTQEHGARFILAFCSDIEGPKKRAFAEAGRFDYLFLLEGPDLNWDNMFRTGGHHWTPRGHDVVCSKLYDYLTAHHVLGGSETN